MPNASPPAVAMSPVLTMLMGLNGSSVFADRPIAPKPVVARSPEFLTLIEPNSEIVFVKMLIEKGAAVAKLPELVRSMKAPSPAVWMNAQLPGKMQSLPLFTITGVNDNGIVMARWAWAGVTPENSKAVASAVPARSSRRSGRAKRRGVWA